MKILFVTLNGIENGEFGGARASIRNYNALNKYANVSVYHIKKKSNIKSLMSILKGYFPPISSNDKQSINESLEKKEFDFVFFDGSHFGKIAKSIRRYNVPIAVFYHNCEYDYVTVRFGKNFTFKKKIYEFLIKKEEARITKFASYKMVFTQRDKERIEKIYDTSVDAVIPIGMNDAFDESEINNQGKEYCLLFGPIGAANIEGFDWFRKNVSPYIRCKTLIAGKGLEQYKNVWSDVNVEVQGYVDNLTILYQNAACIAIPLLSGGGMKIKTAEALMHGKYIFGTEEAFIGYDLIYSEIGGLCNSAEEFIESINDYLDLHKSAYNPYARNLFVDKYSTEATSKEFMKAIRKFEG